mmetsp:Transcript_10715/g.23250  ORF Transcript_10715/g.23250 Transcript_10715/m.23250 type:complete len:250 (+) Transcript_10715:784-1533(+)
MFLFVIIVVIVVNLQLPKYYRAQQHQVGEYDQTPQEYSAVYFFRPQLPRARRRVLVVHVLLLLNHRHAAEAEARRDVLPLSRHETHHHRRPVEREGDAKNGCVDPREHEPPRVRRREGLEEVLVQLGVVVGVAPLPLPILLSLALAIVLVAAPTAVPAATAVIAVQVPTPVVVVFGVLVPVPLGVILREHGVVLAGYLRAEEEGHAEGEEGQERRQCPCQGEEGAAGSDKGAAEGGGCHFFGVRPALIW